MEMINNTKESLVYILKKYIETGDEKYNEALFNRILIISKNACMKYSFPDLNDTFTEIAIDTYKSVWLRNENQGNPINKYKIAKDILERYESSNLEGYLYTTARNLASKRFFMNKNKNILRLNDAIKKRLDSMVAKKELYNEDSFYFKATDASQSNKFESYQENQKPKIKPFTNIGGGKDRLSFTGLTEWLEVFFNHIQNIKIEIKDILAIIEEANPDIFSSNSSLDEILNYCSNSSTIIDGDYLNLDYKAFLGRVKQRGQCYKSWIDIKLIGSLKIIENLNENLYGLLKQSYNFVTNFMSDKSSFIEKISKILKKKATGISYKYRGFLFIIDETFLEFSGKKTSGKKKQDQGRNLKDCHPEVWDSKLLIFTLDNLLIDFTEEKNEQLQ